MNQAPFTIVFVCTGNTCRSPIAKALCEKMLALASPLGLYVHVPFCASTCDFCAFYQTEPTAALVQRFPL